MICFYSEWICASEFELDSIHLIIFGNKHLIFKCNHYLLTNNYLKIKENNTNTTYQDGRRTTKKKMISMTLRKKSKITEEISNSLKEGEYVPMPNSLMDDRPMTNLEKLHFIIGNGILRPDIR